MAVSGGDGLSSGGRGREGREGEEFQREGGRGRLRGAGRESRRREAGREEVEASGAQASKRLCLLAEVEDNRSGQWAGPSSWLHQVSGPGGLLLYFNFCSVFLYLIFLTLFF